MDIDERGRRAAESLERHVSHDLDVPAARAAIDSARRPGSPALVRVATAGFVLALVAGLAVFAADTNGRDGNRVPDRQETPDGEVDVEFDDPTAEELLDIMPAGPLDGKESWRLPVAATPQNGLRDGDLITIVGRGFFPDDYLGVVHCSAEADTLNAGVEACDLGAENGFANVQYVSADANGDVVAQIRVNRFITTPMHGRVDCFETAERCLIGMGAVSDYDRSGGTYINFADAAAYPDPSMSLDPDGRALVPGAPVTAQVTGWIAERPIQFRLCLEPTDHDDISRCTQLAAGSADGTGDHTATFAVPGTVEVGGEPVDCTACVIQATGIGVGGATSQIFPDPIPVTFDRSDTQTPETEPTEPEVPAVDAPVTTDPATATTHPRSDRDF